MIGPELSARPAQSHLIFLDDGRKIKPLRRHLAGLGMTREQYRAKWKFPNEYPMAAPNCAAQRSA